MKIYNTEVYGFRAAIRSMRNPMDSWYRSDTENYGSKFVGAGGETIHGDAPYQIGKNDLNLIEKLVKGGTEHRKFLRMIQVWATWEIPRYVWTEADTYKVGVTRMSCSTMHKLGHKDLSDGDFQDKEVMVEVLEELNRLGKEFRETKNYDLVRRMKRILPEGFVQRADVNFNYETAINMFRQRKSHRLKEWKFSGPSNQMDPAKDFSICDWLYQLPNFKVLVDA